MSTTTPNLGLTKPAGNEDVDIAPINSNFDILDAAAKLRVADGSAAAVSVNQLSLLDNNSSLWKGLDEVRLYNNTDTLICKNGVTTGLLMQNNQIKIVPVTWNNGVPAVGTMKGYIDANGDYHIYDSSTSADSTSLATLRDSVSQKYSFAFNFIQSISSIGSFMEKSGMCVHIYISAQATANILAWSSICTIPSGYRPKYGFRAVAYVNGALSTLYLDENGAVSVTGPVNNNDYIFANFSFICA